MHTLVQPARTRPDERGQSLSSLVAVVLVALLGVAGLVVDGGAQSAARAQATTVASHAARAAADATAQRRASGLPLDVGAAQAAAHAALADRGVGGSVSVVDGRIHVRVTAQAPTTFLSLVGITTLTASGEAAAELRG
ncbi:MAG: pilus assembly protein TadE [Propionibacteriaceae bacterium]|nr:pilus assembly protein TadE [Propionibacteriaceae bacterium]